VVILHHLDDDQILEEVLASYLARREIVSYVLRLPYYGERSVPDDPRARLYDEPAIMAALSKQAVLDCRRAFDLLRHWPATDPDRVGLAGVSLGAINAALAAGVEPRIRRVALVLGGGDVTSIVFTPSREMRGARERLAAIGLGPDELRALWADIEPLRYAHRMSAAEVLMLNTSEDDVIPRRCTEALAGRIGEPELVWYPGTHTGLVPRIPEIFGRLRRHFAARATGED
jgi:dienelactone hydrolase